MEKYELFPPSKMNDERVRKYEFQERKGEMV